MLLRRSRGIEGKKPSQFDIDKPDALARAVRPGPRPAGIDADRRGV